MGLPTRPLRCDPGSPGVDIGTRSPRRYCYAMNSGDASIERFDARLPHGITLSCRAAGPTDAPRLLFLHGFPEGAFVWDEVMRHFADRFRCVAPNFRGYERSSAPPDVAAYRPKELVADIDALIDSFGRSLRSARRA